jgi:23S rRNA pseudouridine1911/1915/1917 synthase
MAKYEHTVTNEEYGMTINTILRLNYRFSSRFRTKMKYQHLVDLNGTPAPGYIKPEVGDVIGVRLPDETSDFPPEDIPLDIIHEDDDLILISKQPGVIVHPTKGHPYHTIANGIMKYMADSGQSFKVRFANRIDMDTSGLIIVCKNANTQNELSNQMRQNTVVKKYIALVEGDVSEDHFFIDLPIGRPDSVSIQRCHMEVEDGGKEARSEVRVLERFKSSGYGPHTLVEVTLHTGRTHQIRVHLSHIGHRIAGDRLYGGSTGLIDRQALHAYYIEFDHPVSGERVSFEAPLPEDIRAAAERCKTDYQNGV